MLDKIVLKDPNGHLNEIFEGPTEISTTRMSSKNPTQKIESTNAIESLFEKIVARRLEWILEIKVFAVGRQIPKRITGSRLNITARYQT